jgi:hypothetical protein
MTVATIAVAVAVVTMTVLGITSDGLASQPRARHQPGLSGCDTALRHPTVTRSPRWLCLPLFAAALVRSGTLCAAVQVEMSAGGEYSSFKTSDGRTSSTWYAPYAARVYVGNWTLRATIPYISITAPNNLIAQLADDPTNVALANDGRAQGASVSGATRTVSGLGDSTLSAIYSFNDIGDTAFYIDVGGRVRLPTGDAHKGTGVGATDYGLQSEVGIDRNRGGVALNGGRRYLGQAPGLDRVDGWQAGAAGWLYLGRHASLGAYYDWRDASEPGLSNPRDAGVYASYRLKRSWKLRLEASRALELPQSNYTLALTLYWRLIDQRERRN